MTVPDARKLTRADVRGFLADHPGWTLTGGALVKILHFRRYLDGMGFAVRVAEAADLSDHHPTLTIGMRDVTVSWVTHSAGGVTTTDALMAIVTDGLLGGRAARAAPKQRTRQTPAPDYCGSSEARK